MMLWLLPVVLLVSIAGIAMESSRRRRLDRMFPPAIRKGMRTGTAPDLRPLRHLLALAGLLLAAFSLARPQWGYTWRDATREGLQLMVVMDTSNSMRADDFQPSRLQRAQWGVEEMVQALKGDKIGLVAFAGQGELLCPLTLDYGTFLMYLQDLFPGIAPMGGTNLEDALETASEGFDDVVDADKVILLITDGENHEGDLDAITERLRQENIRVFAVGVGTPEGSLIPLNETGNEFLKNRRDEVVKSTLDEGPLRRLANATDGLYVRATPRDFGTGAIIDEGLAPLKRARLEGQRVREMEERYQIFLGTGLLLLFLERLARLPAVLWQRRSS
jgi:Ca-activated chloride channel family protein